MASNTFSVETQSEHSVAHQDVLEARITNPALAYLLTLSSEASRDRVGRILDNFCQRLQFADFRSFPWERLTYDQVMLVRELMIRSEAAFSTVNLMLSCIRGVAREAYLMGNLDEHTLYRIREIKNIRGSRTPAGRALSEDESTRLLENLNQSNTPIEIRNFALISVALGAGLRRSEIVGLKLTDYHQASSTLTVVGKGNKERIIYLSAPVCASIQAWLCVRGTVSGFLFVPVKKDGTLKYDRALPANTLYRILQTACKETHIEPISPHSCRRTFATRCLTAGIDISTLKTALGHASITTTTRYDRREDEGLKAIAEKVKP